MSGHPPAGCCCHVFTRICLARRVRAVLSMAPLGALARSERAAFDPPALAGQFLDLWRARRLGMAAGLCPRPLGEIESGLVVAGFARSGGALSARYSCFTWYGSCLPGDELREGLWL